ncbi:hypothetical protein [Oceanospirillum sediminis]|uniref:Uncharacterized protein n=1 Tax=Oceanospirillum sediminis TaxID=2760088 RepID=A0A839IYS1_9GAMM|nr:hypothetical protein [Oceanospirillum sediminis]MBB1489589.1 hypothetical protein [Oceanospirillum sediminis]
MDIKSYKALRAVGQPLNDRILESLTKTDTRIAARAMGVLKGNKVVLPDEDDISRAYDFFIHDYRDPNGETLVERFDRSHPELTDQERVTLDCFLSSSSSLFRIAEVNPVSHTLELEDLLNPGHRVTWMDLGISQFRSLVGTLVYTRILTFPDVNISSGAPLLFNPDVEDTLLDVYPKKMAKMTVGDEQMKRAATFFKLYKLYGIKEMTYR